jgi:uncharacterized protein VcgC/VcgE DUF2780
MDLIASLTSQLGIEPTKAQGLAGAVLGKIEEQVGQKLGGADAAALRAQLPELDGWKAASPALQGGGGGGLLGALGGRAGGGSDLLGAAAGLLGGGGGAGGGLDVASLIQLASNAGLSSGTAQKLLPIVVSFLKSRLDPALLSKVLSVVPGLEKLAGGASGGGLGGLLGGIL